MCQLRQILLMYVLEQHTRQRRCLQESSKYWDYYRRSYREEMQQKLGLIGCRSESDDSLVTSLLQCMQRTGVDMHVTLRSLSLLTMPFTSQASTGQVDASGWGFLDAVLATAASPQTIADCMRSAMDPKQLHLLQYLASESPRTLKSLGISVQAWIQLLQDMCLRFDCSSCQWSRVDWVRKVLTITLQL